MNKQFVIGIVSYFPDEIREQRQNSLNNLINKCSIIFPGIDIIIVAQNWRDFRPYSETNKFIIYKFNKLGIVGARSKLRDIFINSEYDFLIMFDDDNIIEGTKENGDKYINLMKNNPDGFGVFDFYRGQFWGFCISKSLFKKVEFLEQCPETGQIFEDTYISHICLYHHPQFTDLKESGVKIIENWKVKSTWWDNKKYNIKQMEINTYKLIEQYKNNLK